MTKKIKDKEKDEELLKSYEDEENDLDEKKDIDKIDDIDEDILEDDDDYSELSVEDKIDGMEKKLTVIMILVIVTLLFSCVNTIVNLSNGNSNKVDLSNTGSNSSNNSSGSYDTSMFKEITASEIASASKSETIVVWIGRQGCGYCQAYAPYIEEAGKNYGITIRYLDLGKIINFDVEQPYIEDKESWNTLNSLTGSGEWEKFVSTNITGTPLTLVIKNNKVIGGLSGLGEVDQIESMFEDAGLSK